MSRLKNKGFTLLEVMLAVTILSVGLVMVLGSFVNSLRAIKISQDFLVASLLLEEKIWQKEEEKTQSEGLIPVGEEDEFQPPFDKFRYKIRFEEQKDLPSLYKTSFEVSWQERKKERNISCVTYLSSKEK